MRSYLFVLLILGGCASHWHKDDATPRETRAAMNACREDSGPFGFVSDVAFRKCMEQMGYEQ